MVISISNNTLKLRFFVLVVEMGHVKIWSKQKMRKQHVLKMWISALGFKMLFLSVKVENISSMSNGGSRGGARGSPPALFLDQIKARRADKKLFWDRAPFFSHGLDDRPSPPPPPRPALI